jgi:hypothetical protein
VQRMLSCSFKCFGATTTRVEHLFLLCIISDLHMTLHMDATGSSIHRTPAGHPPEYKGGHVHRLFVFVLIEVLAGTACIATSVTFSAVTVAL